MAITSPIAVFPESSEGVCSWFSTERDYSLPRQPTGRDHWQHAFTALLAGGGVRGGEVYGATKENGGYLVEKPVSPADLTATILDQVGIDPSQTSHDEFQKFERQLSVGYVVWGIGA
jgi:hypothetical protein